MNIPAGIFVIHVPDGELDFSFVRSSGPGGQNVNKVNSKAVLRWDVASNQTLRAEVKSRFVGKFSNKLTTEGHLLISSDRFRDQGRNIEDCLEKLRQMLLEVASPPKKRKATRPSFSSKKRTQESKSRQSDKKKSRGRIDY